MTSVPRLTPLLALVCASPAFAATIAVPGDQPTIQAAIDAAVDSDTILVSPGIYPEAIDLLGKEIELRSLSGDPSDTVIDSSGAFHAISITSGETRATIVDGFSITGGAAIGSGADGEGGGIYIVDASPTILNCIILGNQAFTGGGMHVRGAAAAPLLDTCDFVANTTNAGFGSGMIVSNSATPDIVNCRFLGNTGAFQGGGLYTGGSDATVVNCVFSGNDANEGGAIRIFNCSPTFSGCSIAGNGSGTLGGVFHNGGGASEFVNCISWGNSSTFTVFGDSTLTVRSSIVEGSFPANVIDGGGNLDADPQFVDADGADDQFGTPDDDPRVLDGSPAIDAGDANAPSGASTDPDGAPRVRNCRIDIGAYESPFFIDCNGNGVGDACDLDPIVNPEFDQATGGWGIRSDGDGFVTGLASGVATITGSADGSTLGAVTAVIQPIDANSATVAFTLLSYESEDDDACPDGAGSYDFPVLLVDGLVYPLNQDGTVAGPVSPGICDVSGTITNQNPPPAPVMFVVDLEALVGTGPYQVGVGVASTDSVFAPGIATFENVTATTDIVDADGSGVPDSCECAPDIDQSGSVGFGDVLEVLSGWGPCEAGAVTATERSVTANAFSACNGASDRDVESTMDTGAFAAVATASASGDGSFGFGRAEQNSVISATGVQATGSAEGDGSGCTASGGSGTSALSVTFALTEQAPGMLTGSADIFGAFIELRRNGTLIAFTDGNGNIDFQGTFDPGTYTLNASAPASGGSGKGGFFTDFTLTLDLDLSGDVDCRADLDGSGVVDFADLLAVLSAWGPCN